MINSHSFSSRAYFFDNPRRYDSDDDLSRSITSRADRARWAHAGTESSINYKSDESLLSLIMSCLFYLSAFSPQLLSWVCPVGMAPSSVTGPWQQASDHPSSRHLPLPPSSSPMETSRVTITTITTTPPRSRTPTTTTTITVTTTPHRRIITVGRKRISAPHRIKHAKDQHHSSCLHLHHHFASPTISKQVLLRENLKDCWGPSWVEYGKCGGKLLDHEELLFEDLHCLFNGKNGPERKQAAVHGSEF